MASTNQSPFYQKAEQEFHKASTDEERIACLEIMMKEVPKHKSSENMRKNLTNRYKKLKAGIIKQKKSGKSKQAGIKKADMQCVLTGFPNTGKSTIFKILTKRNPRISSHPFTTYQPQLGTFYFEDAPIQIIDAPAFPNHNKSLINSTDALLLVIDKLEQIKKAEKYIYRTHAKIILIYNKKDLIKENVACPNQSNLQISEGKKRKIEANLKSKYKKFNYIFFSSNPSQTEINELTKKIFNTFPIIRIYTKEPKKPASKEPMILRKNSTFREAVEKILKGMSDKIKRARVWGPSSKFGGQTIGLEHILKDKDIIEFQTK